ncbi:hypothetical protein SAMN05216233_10562 [Desulfoluna spongiiphila]|uniref:Uncharacterized protein n=1 Tax=Desulfoluna spongiiphila TaxID=419481 RepID=A0A1G5DY28_9BACT|nr:hypothetical protein SAMN05216233_10562 [Desulfoluna spongiiphila]
MRQGVNGNGTSGTKQKKGGELFPTLFKSQYNQLFLYRFVLHEEIFLKLGNYSSSTGAILNFLIFDARVFRSIFKTWATRLRFHWYLFK